jgi:hypothetical protein
MRPRGDGDLAELVKLFDHAVVDVVEEGHVAVGVADHVDDRSHPEPDVGMGLDERRDDFRRST